MYSVCQMWLSVWNKMQMIGMWSSWWHCHRLISCFIKIQKGFCHSSTGFFFTQVVLEERPLNGCHSSWKVSYQQKHNHCIIVQCNDTSMASRWHQVSKFRRSRIQIIMNLLQHEAQVFSAFYDHWFFFISWGQLTPCPEMMNRHSHFGNGGF